MKKRLIVLICYVLVTTLGAKSAETKTAEEFAAHCKKLGSEQLANGKLSQPGDAEGWLFLQQELQHVGEGEFWSKEWAEVSKAGADPRPAIIAYDKALKAIGVDLILVPVPPKASIYPDKLTKSAKMDGTAPAADAVHPIASFYESLTAAGIAVIDLEPILRAERKKGAEKLYCEQDSHPSPSTCKLIAEQVHEVLKTKDGIKDAKKADFEFLVTEPKKEKVSGDLTTGFNIPPETLTASYAGKPDGKGGVEKVEGTEIDSPVILLGDSHTLIFSDGNDMLLRSAGVRDHLQALLGFGIASYGNKGSGVDTARIRLFSAAHRQPNFWANKKAVVWCIGARTFTRERKWREIPVVKK